MSLASCPDGDNGCNKCYINQVGQSLTSGLVLLVAPFHHCAKHLPVMHCCCQSLLYTLVGLPHSLPVAAMCWVGLSQDVDMVQPALPHHMEQQPP
jgi:hypothetical protein